MHNSWAIIQSYFDRQPVTQTLAMYIDMYVWHVLYHAVNSGTMDVASYPAFPQTEETLGTSYNGCTLTLLALKRQFWVSR